MPKMKRSIQTVTREKSKSIGVQRCPPHGGSASVWRQHRRGGVYWNIRDVRRHQGHVFYLGSPWLFHKTMPGLMPAVQICLLLKTWNASWRGKSEIENHWSLASSKNGQKFHLQNYKQLASSVPKRLKSPIQRKGGNVSMSQLLFLFCSHQILQLVIFQKKKKKSLEIFSLYFCPLNKDKENEQTIDSWLYCMLKKDRNR